MPATLAPLRKPKPPKARWLVHGRFYFTDEKGSLDGGVGTHVCLTDEELWLTSELSIPLHLIDAVQIIERRGLPPRRYLGIRYVNPITSEAEAVFLCKLDPIGIGIHRVGPIQELQQRIEELAARPAAGAAALATPELDRCEVCGAKPAYYVPYLFLVSAMLLSYRSAAKRRLHCRKHNAIHGFAYYFLTALTGWVGIGVFAYPFVVFAAGRNLSPAIGKAWVVLGVLPTIAVAAFLARWLM